MTQESWRFQLYFVAFARQATSPSSFHRFVILNSRRPKERLNLTVGEQTQDDTLVEKQRLSERETNSERVFGGTAFSGSRGLNLVWREGRASWDKETRSS